MRQRLSRTTAGGKVGFNPTLYNNGTVCLSLLGTWLEGLSWNICHESSICQLLEGVQSDILCKTPYNNEPGNDEKPLPAIEGLQPLHLQADLGPRNRRLVERPRADGQALDREGASAFEVKEASPDKGLRSNNAVDARASSGRRC